MPMTESKKKMWTEIIRFIITVLSAVLTALGVDACTMSMTISKNNSGSTATKIESTNRADSTNINLNNYK
jgi:spore maturation protein SpmB